MKIARSQWLLAATACLIVAASTAQSAADRPPGVDEARWLPISDTAGIALTEPVGVALPETDRLELIPTPRPRTGVMMVKTQGRWIRVDLELPPARAHALN
ncbi:MAG TPA: hypothetical protein VF405_11920 [Gammaproteobacteria bacterium]